MMPDTTMPRGHQAIAVATAMAMGVTMALAKVVPLFLRPGVCAASSSGSSVTRRLA
jgi:hypothetical protein